MPRPLLRPAVAALLLLPAALCCDGVLAQRAAAAAPAAAAAGVVIARNFMFAPLTITVKAGSTVTWTNRDEEPHTVVSLSGLFRSAALDTNDSFSFRFDTPGTYYYICTIHPRMTGTIVVQ
ncbi:MAG: cupredoxin family copper-binding protein [Steroidobacteraceae bacterium]